MNRLPAERSVYLGLGANMGDRLAMLRAAVMGLHDPPRVRVVAASPVYETEPVGPAQPDYLNAAVQVLTDLPLRALLDRALALELSLGRVRRERWGPRSIDIDLLFAGEEGCAEEGLTVPHPRLFERAFALAPLLDLLREAPAAWEETLSALGGRPKRHREKYPGGHRVPKRLWDRDEFR